MRRAGSVGSVPVTASATRQRYGARRHDRSNAWLPHLIFVNFESLYILFSY